MKKLLYLLPIMLLFSCTKPTFENSADGLTVIESNEILSQKVDTITVIKYNNRLYQIINNKVIVITTPINKNSSKPIPVGWLGFIFSLILILGYSIGNRINK